MYPSSARAKTSTTAASPPTPAATASTSLAVSAPVSGTGDGAGTGLGLDVGEGGGGGDGDGGGGGAGAPVGLQLQSPHCACSTNRDQALVGNICCNMGVNVVMWVYMWRREELPYTAPKKYANITPRCPTVLLKYSHRSTNPTTLSTPTASSYVPSRKCKTQCSDRKMSILVK